MQLGMFLLVSTVALGAVAPVHADKPKTVADLPCPAGSPVEIRETGLPEPQVLTRVLSDYPPALVAKYGEASCGAMFDINPAGAPVNIEVRCNVRQDGRRVNAPYNDQRRERDFRLMFQEVARHDIGCARYAPMDAARPNLWRTNLYAAFEYAVNEQNGMVPQHAPEPFQRRGAPQITTEQVAYYSYKTRRLREDTASKAGDAPKHPLAYGGRPILGRN